VPHHVSADTPAGTRLTGLLHRALFPASFDGPPSSSTPAIRRIDTGVGPDPRPSRTPNLFGTSPGQGTRRHSPRVPVSDLPPFLAGGLRPSSPPLRMSRHQHEISRSGGGALQRLPPLPRCRPHPRPLQHRPETFLVGEIVSASRCASAGRPPGRINLSGRAFERMRRDGSLSQTVQ